MFYLNHFDQEYLLFYLFDFGDKHPAKLFSTRIQELCYQLPGSVS